MVDPKIAHPDPESLAAFGLGRLDPGRMAEVEAHVAGCDSCGGQLQLLPGDAFTSLLRASWSPPPTIAGLDQDETTLGWEAGPGGFQVPSSFVLTSGPPTAPAESAPPSVPPNPPEVPAALAEHPRYRVVRWLGSGGMGAVYLAEHRLMERHVALKVINRDLTEQPDLVERFRREVRAAARLQHSNIVTSFDAEQAGPVHFLVMEFVEGADLAKLVKAQGPLPVTSACDCVRQAALGLQHAHERGMVHRDIKPQNLMRTPRGEVKILDFGLALLASEVGSHDAATTLGTVLGTADYIAPEQAHDAHTADIRADIYSLGCTLYFLLAGQPPFPGGSLMHKLTAHAQHSPTPLATIRPDLPHGLVRVLDRMIAKDPSQRYQTPAEVAQALTPFAETAASAATVDVPRLSGTSAVAAGVWKPAAADLRPSALAEPGPRRWSRSLRPPIVAAAVALLLLGGGWLALSIYRIQTDKGELIIETDDPSIEVTVKQGGKLVQIVAPQTAARIELRSGDYELSLPEATKGLQLSAEALTLRRGERLIVTVRRVPAPAKPAPAEPVSELLAAVEEVGEIARFTSPKDLVGSPAFLPDGRRVVYTTGGDVQNDNWTKGTDPAVWVASLEGEKKVRKLIGHEPGGIGLVLLRDGRHALTGGADGALRLWDLEAGRSRRLKQFESPVEHLCVAPDGRRAAINRGDTIFVLDLRTGEALQTLRGHGGRIWGLDFCPDGRRLVSCDPDDSTIRVWDLETGRELRKINHGGVDSIAVFPDGRRVLSGGWDCTIGVWDLETGQQLRRIHGIAGGFGAVVAVSPDGRRGLFGVFDDSSIRLWDFETNQEQDRLVGHTGGITSVAFSPDGRRAVSTAFDRTVRVWALPAERPLGPNPPGEIMHYIRHGDGDVAEAAISPDGRQVLSGGLDKTVRLWDRGSGREIRRFEPGAEVLGVAFSPDGRQALSGGTDKVVRLWDLESGRQLRTFEGHGDEVDHVAFSPRGDRILSTSGGESDSTVRVWDVKTGREVGRLKVDPSKYLDADFSPDGQRILSGGDGGVPILWDVATGQEIRRLPGHSARIECVAFLPDGRRAITGCHDNLIRMWDLETGKELHRFEGHTGGIVWVDVSPDGRRLLSASYDDHTLVLWDLESGKRLYQFPWGNVSPTRGRFTPDGRYAVWAGSHESLRLFRLPDPSPER